MKKPITIAGGGLAGLSLGIALRERGVPVIVREAGVYPRHKVCGEFLSGVSNDTLANLGILAELQDAACLSSAAWFDSAGPAGKTRVVARGLSRWALDERLRAKFESIGGNLETRVRARPGPGIIWAAGRARQDGPWVGLKAHFRGLKPSADLEMHSGANGYTGLARVEDGSVNVCGLYRKDGLAKGKGARLLVNTIRSGGLGTLAEKLDAAEADESTFCGVAGFRLGSQPRQGFAVGDAVHMIPPFTGNGMSMAFESAECAIGPALDFSEGRIDWETAATRARRAQAGRFGRRMTAARALHTLLTFHPAAKIAFTLARNGLVPFQTLLSLVR